MIIELLRKRGFRITYSRLRVVEVLSRVDRPLSADEIYGKLALKLDRATVYRTLDVLEVVGGIVRFTFQNRHVYELITTHSHYLVCKECERVERISSCTLDGIEQSSLKSSRKFISLERHALQLVGVCKSCA